MFYKYMGTDTGPEIKTRRHPVAEQIRAINKTEALNDRAYLQSVFVHDYFRDDYKLTQNDDGVERDFSDIDQVRIFAGPDIPNSSKNVANGEISNREGFRVFDSEGAKIISVPQGYMYEVPDDSATLLSLVITNCTTLIARKAGRLWVGHVSYSFDDEISFFLETMKKNGIEPEDVQVITLSGPDKIRYHYDEKNRDNQFKSVKFWRSQEIPEQNIQRYECNLVGNTFEGAIGVSVLNGLLVTQRFDMTNKGAYVFEISESRDVRHRVLTSGS